MLTDSVVRGSSRFSEIADRYQLFSKENILSLSFTDIVIDFDRTVISSKRKSDFILFENNKTGGYNHLGLVKNGSIYNIETFFCQPDDYYIKNQMTVKIVHMKIIDPSGNIYLEEDYK